MLRQSGMEDQRSAARGGRHPLVWVLGFGAGGIWVDHTANLWIGAWCLLAIVALAAWRGLARAGRPAEAAGALLVGVAALAGLWHQQRCQWFAADEIARFARDVPVPVRVRVTALDAARVGPGGGSGWNREAAAAVVTRIRVRADALRQGTSWQPASGQVTLRVIGEVAGVWRGDRLEVAAMLMRVPTPANPGEPDFAAMRRRGRELALLHCRHPACVERLGSSPRVSLLRPIGRLRAWAEQTLEQHVGPSRASLAAGLLLGSRERLDGSVRQSFFLTGTMHLLAISGLHVGILASGLWLLIRLNWFPRSVMFAFTGVLAVGYAMLTGGKPPVVRAVILIVIYCWGRWSGRRAVAWNTWAAAGLLILSLTPGGLFDTGVQLSFLAVAALIAKHPDAAGSAKAAPDPLDHLIAASRGAGVRLLHQLLGRLRSLASASGAVWLVTTPLVAFQFHLVAPVGLLMNLVLWIPVAVALFAGLATLVTAPVPVLPQLLGTVTDRTLEFVQWATAAAAQSRGGHCWVAGPSVGWLVGFYAVLAATQFLPHSVPPRRGRAVVALWLVIGLWGTGVPTGIRRVAGREPLRVSFVAVGHGTSVLIELPGGKTLLYDAGRLGTPETAALPIAAALWSRGISRIDALIVSHADADHYNAVPGLLDRFSIETVFVSPMMFDRTAPGLAALRQAIEASGARIVEVVEGDQFLSSCGVSAEVLHPPPGRSGMGNNSNSIVLAIVYHGARILLTGDLEHEGLEELLAEEPLATQVLMAPHHGSRHSRPADMLDWARPTVVVVSAGGGHRVEQEVEAFRRDGTEVFWTYRDGLVEITVDRRGLSHRRWRDTRW